jgi:hypothetical protein
VETTSPGGKRQTFRITAFERPRLLTLVSRIFASWNQIVGLLRRLEGLKDVA